MQGFNLEQYKKGVMASPLAMEMITKEAIIFVANKENISIDVFFKKIAKGDEKVNNMINEAIALGTLTAATTAMELAYATK